MVSIAVLKHHDSKQHGEERIYFILQLVVHHAGTLGQKFKQGRSQTPGQRPGRSAVYWLALLSYMSGPSAQGWRLPQWAGSSYINHQPKI